MYIPRPFQVSPEQARDLLREITVGHLITTTSQGPMATLLPWVVDDEGLALVGHMARPSAQWQTPWQGQALVIAEGPNGYVSPSWYATKAETGRVVPTWDYVVVHAYGDVVIHDEATWVHEVVRRLTDRHELQRPEPWSVDDAPRDYLESQLRGIVGVEVRIDRVEASVKMSQNKADIDRSGVRAGFTSDGNGPVAEWIERAAT